jgi:uncharacterized protein
MTIAADASEKILDMGRRVATQSKYNVTIPLRDNRALVFNTMSFSFALWKEEDIALYERVGREEMDLDAEELKPFVYGGYVVADTADELSILEMRYRGARNTVNNMTLTIAPTLGCNFGCDYCFQGTDKPFDTMSEEVQDAIVETVRRLGQTKLKNFGVAWYGGEPLLARKLIYDLSDRLMAVCKETNTNYNGFMVTNGWFLTREVAEKLRDRGVTMIQVTLDGPADYHDKSRALLSGRPTYERIVSNLKEVAVHVPEITLSIRVNVDSRNADRVFGMLDQLHEYGLSGRQNFRMYFAPVEGITEGCHNISDVSMTKGDYGKLEAELYRRAYDRKLVELPFPPKFFGLCTATHPNSIVVVPSGDLHKCWDTVSWSNMRVGTIFKHEELEIDERYEPWMDWTPFDDDSCRSCKILPNCAGACSYKFVHNDKLRGEAAALPCPSWKYNINERLFLRAEKLGIVDADAWDDAISATSLATRDEQYDTVSMTSNLRPGDLLEIEAAG